MVIATDERVAGSPVATVLESLAFRRASGVLEIDGDPAGAIHLEGGLVTLARASWCPELTARLLGSLELTMPVRRLLREGGPGDDVAGELVRGGFATAGDLRTIVTSVIVDAVTALTAPVASAALTASAGGEARGFRLEEPRSHWAAGLTRLDVAWVLAEAGERARRMARRDLGPADPVVLCDLGRPAAVMSREQWAIACAIDRPLTVADVARTCGIALCDAVECVGDLIDAGLCTVASRRAVSPEPGPPPLPAASAGQSSAGQPPATQELLHRVLAGLRKLS